MPSRRTSGRRHTSNTPTGQKPTISSEEAKKITRTQSQERETKSMMSHARQPSAGRVSDANKIWFRKVAPSEAETGTLQNSLRDLTRAKGIPGAELDDTLVHHLGPGFSSRNPIQDQGITLLDPDSVMQSQPEATARQDAIARQLLPGRNRIELLRTLINDPDALDALTQLMSTRDPRTGKIIHLAAPVDVGSYVIDEKTGLSLPAAVRDQTRADYHNAQQVANARSAWRTVMEQVILPRDLSAEERASARGLDDPLGELQGLLEDALDHRVSGIPRIVQTIREPLPANYLQALLDNPTTLAPAGLRSGGKYPLVTPDLTGRFADSLPIENPPDTTYGVGDITDQTWVQHPEGGTVLVPRYLGVPIEFEGSGRRTRGKEIMVPVTEPETLSVSTATDPRIPAIVNPQYTDGTSEVYSVQAFGQPTRGGTVPVPLPFSYRDPLTGLRKTYGSDFGQVLSYPAAVLGDPLDVATLPPVKRGSLQASAATFLRFVRYLPR